MARHIEAPVHLELPEGERYELHPNARDLKGYLRPEHVPHLKPGIAAIKVRVTHGESGYQVSLAPDELELLLRRARLEAESQVEHAPQPKAMLDPSRGQGTRDPETHRLGPNVDHRPDPGHRGQHRLQRKP